MSYGRSVNEDVPTRSCDAGRTPTTPGLDRLRVRYLQACQEQADALFPPPPLDNLPGDPDTSMLALQSDQGRRKLVNSIWAQEARMTALSDVREQHERARRNLYGRLLHVGAIGDVPLQLPDLRVVDRLVNLPEEWSGILSPADRDALQARTKDLPWDAAFSLMGAVAHDASDLPHAQADAVFALVQANRERFGCPRYDVAEGTAQLRLTWSAVRDGRTDWEPFKRRVEDAMFAAMALDRVMTVPFRLTGTVAREDPVDMVVELHPDLLRRHAEHSAAQPRVRGVSVDVGPRETVVRVLLMAEPRLRAVGDCLHVLARDFGYRNTIALTMVRIPLAGISQERLDWVARVNAMTDDDAKAETRRFLEAHRSDAEVVLQHVFDGSGFMRAVAAHTTRLDALRREVDRVYRRIRSLKHEVNRFLGAPEEALVDLEAIHGDKGADGHVRRLGKLLALVGRLKVRKRGVHATVRGLKASWFGHLANVEAELAQDHAAVMVKEDLTIGAIPQDDPRYKGKTFNRMMHNGCRSGYEGAAAMKHEWRGTPVVDLPSFHTSTTDHRHGVVDKGQRRDETFTSKVDGLKSHADAWASHTLACYLIMQPKPGHTKPGPQPPTRGRRQGRGTEVAQAA